MQKTSPQSYKTQIKILPFPGGWPKSIYLRAQERPATLILTVTSGLRITRARHDYNRDAETGS